VGYQEFNLDDLYVRFSGWLKIAKTKVGDEGGVLHPQIRRMSAATRLW
jgi:hypothetical protein